MTLNETDGWERIDLHPVHPERFTHLCARFQAERKILQGDTYHISLRINKKRHTKETRRALRRIRKKFKGHSWYGWLPVAWVNGRTETGGRQVVLRSDGPLSCVLKDCQLLRDKVGEHGGGPLTVSF